jgi:hypothetical protein
MARTDHRLFFGCVLAVVSANYVAQVPYYLYLYYLPHRAPPSLSGTLMLGATLAWFLAGYVLLTRGRRAGYWLLLSFLVVEVTFYAYNIVNQVAHGFAPFFHLQNRDPLLWTVFAIGYLNLLCGVYFVFFLLRHRRTLAAERPRLPTPGALAE